MSTRLLIMGPPGAGKGTQAKLLAEQFGIVPISTGDIFRTNVGAGTALGREAQTFMDAGSYVPDELTNAMVRARLGEEDVQVGFLLDGYPRTLAQVEYLDAVLAEHGAALDRVLELTVDVDEVVARLHRRADLEGRADDTVEVIRRRQEVYAEQTAPLTRLYSERGLLVQVDGMGPVEDVTARAVEAVKRGPSV